MGWLGSDPNPLRILVFCIIILYECIYLEGLGFKDILYSYVCMIVLDFMYMNVLLYSGMYICIPLYRLLFLLLFLCLGGWYG